MVLRHPGPEITVASVRSEPPGKIIDVEKAGRQTKKMTPSKANAIREDRKRGKVLPNVEREEAKKVAKQAEEGIYTFNRL